MRNSVPPMEFRAERMDDCLALLDHQWRRFVLSDLVRHYQPVPTYDLVDRLADRGPADGAQRREVRRRLREEHLPLMRNAGLIETTRDDETLTATRLGLAVENARRGLLSVG